MASSVPAAARPDVRWQPGAGRQERGGCVLHARMGEALLMVEQSPEAATSYFMVWQIRPHGVVMPVLSGHRADMRAAMSASEEAAARMAQRTTIRRFQEC